MLLLLGQCGIVLHVCCVYPLFVAAIGFVFFVVVFAAVVVVSAASASAAVVADDYYFAVAAVSFIALSDGESVDYLTEGGKRL